MNRGVDKHCAVMYTLDSSKILNQGGVEMPYNYSRLLGRIVEKVGTQSNFAERIGLSERSVSLKLNGRRGWKQSEIAEACKILEIRADDIPIYFFAM